MADTPDAGIQPGHLAATLPSDVLFLLYKDILFAASPHARCERPPLISCSQVCRQWRSAALEHKSLWKYIPLYSRSLCKAFLERSQPLHVVIYLSQVLHDESEGYRSAVDDLLSDVLRIEEFVHYGNRRTEKPPGDVMRILSPNPHLKLLRLHCVTPRIPAYSVLDGNFFNNLHIVMFTNSIFGPPFTDEPTETVPDLPNNLFGAVTRAYFEDCILDSRNKILQLLLEQRSMKTLSICHGTVDVEGQRMFCFPDSLQELRLIGRCRYLAHAVRALEANLPSDTCLELHVLDMWRTPTSRDPLLKQPCGMIGISLLLHFPGLLNSIFERIARIDASGSIAMMLSSSPDLNRTTISFHAPGKSAPLHIVLHFHRALSPKKDFSTSQHERRWSRTLSSALQSFKVTTWGHQLRELTLEHNATCLVHLIRSLAGDTELFPELRTLHILCKDHHEHDEVLRTSNELSSNRPMLQVVHQKKPVAP
ncbi:hypothetical protein PENSPDRAFT_247207 [Peniophora sp. CONT]|nr:hypothetical protein PENSPDRAFT_247207 [Peniophora sp. CONT]